MKFFGKRKKGRTTNIHNKFSDVKSEFSKLKGLRKSKRVGKTLDLKSKNKAPKVNRGRRIKVFSIFLLMIALSAFIALIFLLFVSDTFKVQEIRINSNSETIDENILKSYLLAYRGKNIIGVNVMSIETSLKRKFPLAEVFNVKKILPSTLVLEYGEYLIKANVIIKNPVTGDRTKHKLNEIGRVAISGQDDPNLPYIIVETEKELDFNKIIVRKERLDYMLDAMQKYSEKFDMQVIDAEYIQNAKEVHLNTEKGFEVWIDLEGDLDAQLNKLKLSIGEVNIYELDLEYVDLRISGQDVDKIIYKER